MKYLNTYKLFELKSEKIEKIRGVYNDLTKYYKSNDSGIVGWSSKHSQQTRYVQLLKYVEESDTILDYGCGVGDMFGFIGGKYNYIGIDINEGMIKLAKEKYPNGNFNEMNDAFSFEKYEYDWFLASGVFSNYISEKEVIEILKPAFEKANKGLAVNFLTIDHAGSSSNKTYLRGYDPKRLIRIFKKNINNNAELIEGYLENDFTIIFRK